MNRFTLVFLLTVFIAGNAPAVDDPMISVFRFQSQMANSGSVEAMMKLGAMYEEGVGTKQDLDKALKIYRQAQAKGAKEAAASIKRVMKEKKYALDANNRALKQKAARRKAAQEKALKEKSARKREKAARQKVARDKAIREKAVREKAARNKAMKEKAARTKAAREKAARDKAIREKLAKEKAALAKAAGEQAAQEQAAREKAAVEKAAQEEAARKKAAAKKTKEGFTTDPCDTPAARFMSNCRKR